MVGIPQVVAPPTQAASPRPTVLVVDDDLDMQALVSGAIRRAGFASVCCSGALDGLRVFHELQPAMLFLDLMLPDLSGLEVCRRLRAEGARIPMVAISARDLPEDEANVVEAGFDMFIHKPMRMGLVSRAVTRFLGEPVDGVAIRSRP